MKIITIKICFNQILMTAVKKNSILIKNIRSTDVWVLKRIFFREIESYFIRLLFVFTLKISTGPCACKDIDIINNCNYCYLPFKLLEKNWECQYFKLNLWWKISPSVCLPLRLRSSRSYESAYLSRRGREGMMSRIICLVKQVHFSPSHIHTLSWLCK